MKLEEETFSPVSWPVPPSLVVEAASISAAQLDSSVSFSSYGILTSVFYYLQGYSNLEHMPVIKISSLVDV